MLVLHLYFLSRPNSHSHPHAWPACYSKSLEKTSYLSCLIWQEVYSKCKEQVNLPKEEMINHVQDIYKPFTAAEISKKISELLTPKGTKAKVEIIYQSISDLHASCPDHKGDWYFSGNYPTPGGVKVVNKAFMNYIEGINARAY